MTLSEYQSFYVRNFVTTNEPLINFNLNKNVSVHTVATS